MDMDLFIETLTGTAFELRVSPFDTIISIKAKIQRLEGIPVSQQHLIWQSMELEDDLCLHDFDITDGATIRLVLAMRGGPINTRRISVEDPSLEEMAEYMEANRSEIWDKLMKDNRQVTLLVFRDGDQLNFLRVHDRGDGTLTPLSESISAASMYNMYDEEDDDDNISKEKLDENDQMKKKMQLLRAQMAKVHLKKKPKFVPRPPSSGRPGSSLAKRRLRFANNNLQTQARNPVDLKPEKKHSHHRSRHKLQDAEFASNKTPLPPVTSKNRNTDRIDVSDIMSASNMDSKIIQDLTLATRHSGESHQTMSSHKDRSNVKEILKKNSRGKQTLKPLTSRDSSSGKELLDSVNQFLKRESSFADEETPTKNDIRYDIDRNYRNEVHANATIDSTKHGKSAKLKPRIDRTASFQQDSLLDSETRLLGRPRVCSPEETISTILREPKGFGISIDTKNVTCLPRVDSRSKAPPQLVPNGRKRARCFLCAKKLGLATNYHCRCGNSFCASHRYAEAHSCSYDYKGEGRKVLQQSNPVVTAPKLPKI